MAEAAFESRQLLMLVVLGRTNSFTMTARELSLSQSAVSHAIKGLEEEVGVQLVDRVGKRICLTPAGEQLFHHAERVLKQMEEARQSLEMLSRWGQTQLRIGASTTVCEYILPRVLRSFQSEFPQCQVTIEPGDSPELIDLVLADRVDIAIGLRPRRHSELEFEPLFTDELGFVLAPDHPWVANGKAIRSEIPRQHYVLYNQQSYTFQMVTDYFRKEGFGLNSCIQFGSMEAIKELVKLDLGVAVLAPWIVQDEVQDGTLAMLPLGQRKLKRTWGLIAREGRRRNWAEETFMRLSREVSGTLVCDGGALRRGQDG